MGSGGSYRGMALKRKWVDGVAMVTKLILKDWIHGTVDLGGRGILSSRGFLLISTRE